MKVVIDVFGGDNAPNSTVLGSIKALNKCADLKMVLCGDEEKINEILKTQNYDATRIEIIDAKEVITNNESPTSAIRTKRESSLVKALDKLRLDEEVVGFVGAGSTGAVLTGAFMKLGRIKGISRPALCPILPTINGGKVAIIDCGANMDSKPINLCHFALMGSAYLKKVFGIENPRVALLSVGVEDEKGNELVKSTFPILKEMKNINFVGNMESRDLLSGNYDLIVTDGFAGNVLLKSTEGAILNLLKLIKKEIKSRTLSKIGYLFMKKSFDNLKSVLDYNDKGGAVLLGCKKLVVKSHGSSGEDSICASILQVVDMHKAEVCKVIEEEINSCNLDEILEKLEAKNE